MNRRELLRGIAATGLLGSAAGCTALDDSMGSGGSLGTASAPTTDPDEGTTTDESTSMADATVAVASTDEFGEILVGSEGMTLYLFTKDEGTESVCYDDCAATWPPLVVDGEPTAGGGVSAELGTTERRDGSMQVTAAGHPLYYFAGDEEPGDTNGQGLGDAWYVLSPEGERIGGSEGSETTEEHHEVPDGPAPNAAVAMGSGDDGSHFDPHVVWVERGGTVTWTLESGAHSTTAYHPDNDRPARIPAGAAAWDSGVLSEQGATFEHTFETEGVYDYFCIPHESMGMLGSVIVGNPDPEGQPALAPPQEDLPEAARSKIEELNGMVREALSESGTADGSGTTSAGSETPDDGPYY